MQVSMALTLLQLAYQLLGAAQGYNVPEWQRQQAITTANNAIVYAQSVIQSQSGFNYNPYVYNNANTNYSTGATQIIFAADGIQDHLPINKYIQIVWSPYNPSQGYVDVEVVGVSNTAYYRFLGRTTSNTMGWLVDVPAGTYTVRLKQELGGILGTRTAAAY